MKNLIVLQFLALLWVAPLRAALISHEGFSGYPANATVNNRNGGTGWQSAWNGAGMVVSPGRAFPGLVASGNALRTTGGTLASIRPFTTLGFETLRTSSRRFGLDGTELWLSFLARRDTNFTTADYAGLSLLDGGQKLFVGCTSGGSHWSLQLFDLGTVPSSITLPTATPIVTGETALLVLRLQFGVNGTQDRVELFVNPPPGVTPTTPDASHTGADFRFNQVRVQTGTGAAAAMSFDEIRLGEGFGDVVPTTVGPALAWLRHGPQSVTAGAEITLPLHYAWPDGNPETLVLSVTSANGTLMPADRIVVTGTGSNRRVTLRPPLGDGGTTPITATITPPVGAPLSVSFDLIVDPTPSDELLAYEGFDYTPDFTAVLQKSGGFGFDGPWSNGVQGAFGSAFTINSPSLLYPGLASQGARARVISRSNHGVLRQTTLPLGEDGTVRYLSFLVRPEGSLATDYFGLRLIGSAGPDLFVGKPGGGSTDRYVIENAGGAAQFPATNEVMMNSVALLVLKLEFQAGQDRVSLFVNPPLGGSEPAVPNAVKGDLDLGLVAAIAFNSSPAWGADELRLGTTFASVTPRSADFALRPVNPIIMLEQNPLELRIEPVDPLPAGRTLSFAFVGDGYGATLDAATGDFFWRPDEPVGGGPQLTFTVRATSNATPPDSQEVTFNVTVREVNVPPQIASIGDLTVMKGTPLSYHLMVIDPDFPVQERSFSILDGPEGLEVSAAGHLTWTPTPAQLDRTFTAKVRVSDGIDAAEQTFTLITRSQSGPAPEIVVEQPEGRPLFDGTTRMDFGGVVHGTTASFKELTFIIRNTGDAILSDLGITIAGSAEGDFSVTSVPSTPVPPGGSVVFTVRFAPKELGSRFATLHLASNDGDENPFDVALMGSSAVQAQETDDYCENPTCALSWFATCFRFSPSSARSIQGAQQNGTTTLSLGNYYALQSLMNQSEEGRRLTGLYWQNTREIARIAIANPALAIEAHQLLLEFQPAVSALLSGNGSGVQITQPMIDQLNRAWAGFADASSPALKAALDAERERFNGFQAFVGKNFSEWAGLLQVPVPAQPYIQAFNPTQTQGVFTVGANYILGLAYTLWKSANPGVDDWTLVPADGIQFNADGVGLTDTNASPHQLFYTVRAQEAVSGE